MPYVFNGNDSIEWVDEKGNRVDPMGETPRTGNESLPPPSQAVYDPSFETTAQADEPSAFENTVRFAFDPLGLMKNNAQYNAFWGFKNPGKGTGPTAYNVQATDLYTAKTTPPAYNPIPTTPAYNASEPKASDYDLGDRSEAYALQAQAKTAAAAQKASNDAFNDAIKGGWFAKTPQDAFSLYTGTPAYQQEAAMVRDYFNRYGRLPTAQQSAKAVYVANPGLGYTTANADNTNVNYFSGGGSSPASTMYNRGFDTPEQANTAASYGLPFGPRAGKDVPYDSVVVKDKSGNPYLRFPSLTDPNAASLAQSNGYFSDMSDAGIYPQQPQYDFKPEAPMSFEEYSNTMVTNAEPEKNKYMDEFIQEAGLAPREADQTALDYLESLVESEDLTKEKADMIADRLVDRFEAYVGQKYSNYLDALKSANAGKQNAYNAQFASQAPAGWGNYGVAQPQPQQSPVEVAQAQNKQAYEQFIASRGTIGEAARVWMENAYPELVGTWTQYGQGQDFITWVRKYLVSGGKMPQPNQPNSRRFAPQVSYR